MGDFIIPLIPYCDIIELSNNSLKEEFIMKMVRKVRKKNCRTKARCVIVKYEYKKPMTCINTMRDIIQSSMKEKGITPEQARKSIGIKRYEK